MKSSGAERLSLPLVLAVASLGVAGCGTDVARTTLAGGAPHDVPIVVPAATKVHFVADVEYERASDRAEWLGQYTLKIETLRDGKVVGAPFTCDALDVGLGMTGGQSCDGHHAHCTMTSSNSRIKSCELPVEAGASTLRMTLVPTTPATTIVVKRLDLVIRR